MVYTDPTRIKNYISKETFNLKKENFNLSQEVVKLRAENKYLKDKVDTMLHTHRIYKSNAQKKKKYKKIKEKKVYN